MIAAIDIGTNTVLLLIAMVNADGRTLRVLNEEQRIPRLGQGVDKERFLSEEAMQRVIDSLTDYRLIIEHQFPKVKTIIVTATSAVRDAKNRDPFMQLIKDETGFDVRLLTGEEEAQLTYKGALSVLENRNTSSIVIDIGGGSTELALGNGLDLFDHHSFDIGSVRFTERYMKSDIPTSDELKNCRSAIKEAFGERPFKVHENTCAIGVAGTVTSLACMVMGMDHYIANDLNGYQLKKDGIKHWVKKLSKMSSQEILEALPRVLKGRADIIVAGLLILDEFLEEFKFDELIVSTGGIRHGAILNSSDLE